MGKHRVHLRPRVSVCLHKRENRIVTASMLEEGTTGPCTGHTSRPEGRGDDPGVPRRPLWLREPRETEAALVATGPWHPAGGSRSARRSTFGFV